jgi:predicted DNA-binding transcriptional regulator YafY
MTLEHAHTPTAELNETRELALVRDEGAWRVFPLEGTLELHYRDVAGNPSRRRILGHELKVGPGKTLLGGIDQTTDGYRGFRADRIDYLIDVESGQTVDRNILDWLIKRAQRQLKEREKALRQQAEAA